MPIQKYWNGTSYQIFDSDDSESVDGISLRMNGGILEVSEDNEATWTAVSMSASDILTALKTVDGSGSGLDADTLDSYGTSTAATANTVAVRNSSGDLYGTKVYGAVYNDYAEYRHAQVPVKPGKVVKEVGNGQVQFSQKRCEKACMVVTDTYGFIIGDKDKANPTPVAVAGRVLAYPDKSKFKIGDPVCSGKFGTVSKMRWWEKILYPERMIGTVSEIPTYDKWGQDSVQVDGRIWINVK
jgi:hypothetical protein